MKMDRGNPRHWLWLIASGLWASIATMLRPFRGRNARPRILLYGHKLGGNLLALYRHLRAGAEFDVAFVSLDADYAATLQACGESAVSATSWRCVGWLARADALVSDHGLHALELLLRCSDLPFFDTWHGIPFKGFDAQDFRVQRRYREVWVASESQRRLWIERFGFEPHIVKATGYPRTDRLVKRVEEPAEIRRHLGFDAPPGRKVILFAPTWRQDEKGRSIFPFGCDADGFLGALSQLAARNDATVLLRTHLNSGHAVERLPEGVIALPYALYPDTEAILLASDVLVCDWSSIAFDYLLLDRPTVFLDVPPPFRKGFSLGPEFRFGSIVADLAALLEALNVAIARPDLYWAVHGSRHELVRTEVYGPCADGQSTRRCLARLASVVGRADPVRPESSR